LFRNALCRLFPWGSSGWAHLKGSTTHLTPVCRSTQRRARGAPVYRHRAGRSRGLARRSSYVCHSAGITPNRAGEGPAGAWMDAIRGQAAACPQHPCRDWAHHIPISILDNHTQNRDGEPCVTSGHTALLGETRILTTRAIPDRLDAWEHS